MGGTVALQSVNNFLFGELQSCSYDRVTWEIVTLRKPMSTKAKPRLTLVFEG